MTPALRPVALLLRRRIESTLLLQRFLAGTQPGRESNDEITLYKSVGVAIEDVVTANLVYQRAVAG